MGLCCWTDETEKRMCGGKHRRHTTVPWLACTRAQARADRERAESTAVDAAERGSKERCTQRETHRLSALGRDKQGCPEMRDDPVRLACSSLAAFGGRTESTVPGEVTGRRDKLAGGFEEESESWQSVRTDI
jgi:hypothetical protein